MKMSTIAAIVVAVALFNKVAANDDTQFVLAIEGPTVLHASIAGQWGGHTFCYLLLSEHCVFWSATAYNPKDKVPTVLIGQQPRPGSLLAPAVSTIRFDEPNVKGCNQPQMLRSPDGYIHIFIGVTHTTDNPNFSPGKLRYFRSDKPEDISTLADRTELIPIEPYDGFHLRMNVGISSDGRRMTLVILAISEDGSVPFNTPVIFIGEKQGIDFVFQKPVQYAEPMSLFYPQVVSMNEGIVIIGEVWDKAEQVTTRLLHLNWEGALVHREELPADDDGAYLSFDLRPIAPSDWNKLIFYYNRLPKEHTVCHHEFWEYDVQAKQLRRLRSLKTEYNLANPGKWIPVSSKSSVFINNPCMSQLHVWEGDILGGGEVTRTPLRGANPLARGYQASSYLFVPNPLQGSIASPGEIYIASDCFNPCKDVKNPGPCSFLLWRLRLGVNERK